MAAHLAEDQSCDATAAIIGMSADSAEIAAYAATLAYLRERTGVADNKSVRIFIDGNNYRLIKVGKYRLFPPGILDRIKKLVKSVVLIGIIVSYFDSALLE